MRFVLILAAGLAAAAGCSRPPDEARLRETIAEMQSATEARDASGVLDGIAADFVGRNGEVDRDGLARILKLGVDWRLARRDLDRDRRRSRDGALRDEADRPLAALPAGCRRDLFGRQRVAPRWEALGLRQCDVGPEGLNQSFTRSA
jgi:hypothetical protein